MDDIVIEAQYPVTFRNADAKILGVQLQHRNSVELVGMKRVGISNFLRFFLHHKDIKKQYMPKDGRNIFISIDLNDLIEREIFPFWRLTFKRIIDEAENLQLSDDIKKRINNQFSNSIQSSDVFITFDGIRASLMEFVKAGYYPTLFFIRFDRLKEAITKEFLDNLYGLKEATGQKIAYVFTGVRELDKFAPNAFNRRELFAFSHILYFNPGEKKDMKIILDTFLERYEIDRPKELETFILDLAGGHVQYLQLILLIFQEIYEEKKSFSMHELLEKVENDERILLQSDELWESLNDKEQEVLLKVANGKVISSSDKKEAEYLWNVGFVQGTRGVYSIFSPMFANHLLEKEGKSSSRIDDIEFSKKEYMLYELLKNHSNEICEREKIVEIVWPEYKEYGVSDWSIDRLVARVRSKIKKQKDKHEIVTVRTRGYKLVTA